MLYQYGTTPNQATHAYLAHRHGGQDFLEEEQVEAVGALELVGQVLQQRRQLNVWVLAADQARERGQPLEPLLRVDAVGLQRYAEEG